jgi:hypothetical protein
MPLKTIVFGLLLGAGVANTVGSPAVAQENVPASHVHIGHAADSWSDTPFGSGLVTIARVEAEIADAHAQLGTINTGLEAIQLHVGHVMNAIDPTSHEQGPGRGYGMIRASTGGITHVGLAADSEDASDNVKRHAPHIVASIDNALSRAREIISLGYQVQAASDLSVASALAQQIRVLTTVLIGGEDANGDGSVGWDAGEGGLQQAQFHLSLMKRGEGLP